MSPAARRAKPDQAKSAAAALLGAAPLVTRWMERLLAQSEAPMTVPQYLALRAIADEPVTAAELAHRAAVSGPAVSQLLAGLVSAGWVSRVPSATDRRRQELSLTGDGRTVLAAVEQTLTARLGELIAGTPPPELDALGRGLPFVRAALAGTPPPRRPAPPHGPHPPHGPKPPPRPPEPPGRPPTSTGRVL